MTSSRHDWQDDAACLGEKVNDFFDNYEEDEGGELRQEMDGLCRSCPVMRTCFAYAKYYRLTGVWGGIYMNKGDIDKEMNNHKTPDDWAKTYVAITS